MKLKIVIWTCAILLATGTLQRAEAQSWLGSEKTTVVRTAGITTETQLAALADSLKQTTTQYTDGLGRVIQTVAVQASPTQKDLIQPVVYNTLGQQVKSLLAYAGADGSGSFRGAAVTTEQPAFYANGAGDKVTDDSFPFSQQVFENSPLQRVLNSGMAGAGFQPAGALGTQHYQTLSYRSNSASLDGSIIVWGPDGSNQGNYADNQLAVTDGRDEDGVETLTFKDLSGQLVLKRQKNASANLDTYYIYNNAGKISYVVPPLALKAMAAAGTYSPEQAVAAKLVFKYVYDERGRLVEKTVPGAGVIYIVYDPLNRPVLVQDARLRAVTRWNYIKYDVKGRVISQGLYTDAVNTSRAAMQAYVTTGTVGSAYNTAWYESRATASATGYYSNVVFPTTNLAPLAYSYYDDYDLDNNGSPNYAYVGQSLTGESSATTAAVKDLPTAVRSRTVGNGLSLIWLSRVMFYDKNGRLIQTQSNNQLNYTAEKVTDYTTSALDFTGKARQTKVLKVTGTSAAPVTTSILTSLRYDRMYRLTAVDQSYNGGATLHVAAYSYNELGQLVQKKLQPGMAAGVQNVTLNGSNSVASGATLNVTAGNMILMDTGFTVAAGGTFSATVNAGALQSVDFRYNIRGQLTSINNSSLSDDSGGANTNGDGNDLFGMQLLYDQTDGDLGNTPVFNGKLSAVKWMSRDASGTRGNERSLRYGYDALGRYTGSTYGERTGGGAFNVNAGGFNENNITYDDGGNLLSLKRNAIPAVGGAATEVDNLNYTYDPANPNQLRSVTDGTGSAYTAVGFRNLSGTGSGTYGYDMNGSLTSDPYKSLGIAYNVLNRTDQITITSATGRYLAYTYGGDGQLIRKQQYDNNVLQTTTDYVDGLVYLNGTLSYFPMPEGRIRNTGAGGLKAEYMITDQQGNARISLEESSTSPGTAVVRQENSYYGFGLVMPGSPVSLPVTDNKQLYNGGSEWQNDFNNLPDYYQTFYRNYDAALGRFIGVDPQGEATESLSTYHYAGNNPISYNDPIGDVPVAFFSNPNRYYRNLVPQDPGNPNSSSFGNFVANDPNNSYGADLLEDAKNGDPYALAIYIALYGKKYDAGNANGKSYYFDRNGNLTGAFDNADGVATYEQDKYIEGENAIKGYNHLSNAEGAILLAYNDMSQPDANQGRESIDWGGATNAFFGVLGGVAEVGLGVLTSESGVGLFAIGDGGMRTILNAGRLFSYLSGHKNDGDVIPSNTGAMLGKTLDNEFLNVSADKVGRFQTAFGILNDAATMSLTHTTWNAPAINATSAVAGVFSDAYTVGYYYNFFINPNK